MTREQAKELLPIISAFANGEVIQTILEDGRWQTSERFLFDGFAHNYRIKPKPREFTIFLAGNGTILHKSPNSDDIVEEGYRQAGIQAVRVREIIED